MNQKEKIININCNDYQTRNLSRIKRLHEGFEVNPNLKKFRKPFADTKFQPNTMMASYRDINQQVQYKNGLPPIPSKAKPDDNKIAIYHPSKSKDSKRGEKILRYFSIFKDDKAQLTKVISIKLPKISPGLLRSAKYEDEDLAHDTTEYLFNLERQQQISCDYLIKLTNVTPHKRSVLVDWLIQVQDTLNLSQETLYLSIMIVDRVLAKKDFSICTIQLLGITSIFIVAKLEDRSAPKIEFLIHLTDDAYKYSDVIIMERFILKILKFNLIMAEPMAFLKRYLQFCTKNAQVKNLSMFFLDTFLLDKESAVTLPSQSSAAALCLARNVTFGNVKGFWNKTLVSCTTYTEEKLRRVMLQMVTRVINSENSPTQGAKLKYSSVKKYGGVSKLPSLFSSELITILNRLSR